MSHPHFEHRQLVVSHTFLDYINGILMDESLENYGSCHLLSPQNDRAYRLIFDGFHGILTSDEGHLSSASLVSACAHDHSQAEGGTMPSLSDGFGWDSDGHTYRGIAGGYDVGADIYNRVSGSGAFAFDRERGGKSMVLNHVIVDVDRDKAICSSRGSLFGQTAAATRCQHDPQITSGSSSDGCKFHSDNQLVHHHSQKISINGDHSLQLSWPRENTQDEDVSFVLNEELAAEQHAQLFDEWRGRGSDGVSERSSSRLKNKGREDAALANPVDLKALLLRSSKALAEGDPKRAMELLQQVWQQGASPNGTGLQRVAHYFSEAMVARMSGMGSTLYTALSKTSQLPSVLLTLKAYKMLFEVCPYLKTAYYFANQYILKASHRTSCLHIVDYGIFYGFQWPCLIYALAHRVGGPPFLRITGIELPTKPADINPSSTIEGTGRRLMEYARTYNVPFEYFAVSADNWEDIDPASLLISPDEVLVVNSFNRLHHLHDESNVATLSPPRDRLLQQMRRLNPHLLVTGFMNASHSSPFFFPRFREALHYYCNMFDTLHTLVPGESMERAMLEREVMGRTILNVVACEGTERVERPEMYKQWQLRIQRAGFQQRSLIPSVLSTAESIMKAYHKDFCLLQDSNKWLLLGWRGRTMQSLSAWEPASLI